MIYLACHEKLTSEPIFLNWLTSLVLLSAPAILLTSAIRGPFSMAHTCQSGVSFYLKTAKSRLSKIFRFITVLVLQKQVLINISIAHFNP
jgi:hypothetical protein